MSDQSIGNSSMSELVLNSHHYTDASFLTIYKAATKYYFSVNYAGKLHRKSPTTHNLMRQCSAKVVDL